MGELMFQVMVQVLGAALVALGTLIVKRVVQQRTA